MYQSYISNLQSYERNHKKFISVWNEIKRQILSTNTSVGYLEGYEVLDEIDYLLIKFIDIEFRIKFIKNDDYGGLKYYYVINKDKIHTILDLYFDDYGNFQNKEYTTQSYEYFSKIHMMIINKFYPKLVELHYLKEGGV